MVQRYSMYVSAQAFGRCHMDEKDDGKYVKYEDYVRLEAELDALRAKAEAQEPVAFGEMPSDGQFVAMWSNGAQVWSATMKWEDGQLKSYNQAEDFWDFECDHGFTRRFFESRKAVFYTDQPKKPVAVPDMKFPHSWCDAEGTEVMSAEEVREAYQEAFRAAMIKQPSTIHTSDSACSGGEIKQPASKSLQVPEGWIPCSERMPEREYVLAADFSGAYYLPSLPNTQVGIYSDWFEDGKPSWDDGDGNDLKLKQVTHWMPIHAAPQPESE